MAGPCSAAKKKLSKSQLQSLKSLDPGGLICLVVRCRETMRVFGELSKVTELSTLGAEYISSELQELWSGYDPAITGIPDINRIAQRILTPSKFSQATTVEYARLVSSRVKRVLGECKVVFWNDIQASAIQKAISGLRKNAHIVETEVINGKKIKKPKLKDIGDISAQTCNYYLKAVKQFCRWMVQDQRAAESQVEHLRSINPRADRRHDRRPFELDEIRRLLEATAAAPWRYGMSGYERALLYRLTVETGLRRDELKSLEKASFDLENYTVTVKAAYSKNRREAVLPLRKDTAAELEAFLAGKLPRAPVFSVPRKTAEMLRADLAATEVRDKSGKVVVKAIPYIDDAGRYADFHALRHSTGSLLAASGTHPKVAQSILRHGSIDLTMSRYTHTYRGQESEAVECLPDFSLPSRVAQKAVGTGTDGRPVEPLQNGRERLTPKLTPKLTPTAFSGYDRSAAIGTEQDNHREETYSDNCLAGETLDNESDSLSENDINEDETRPTGFEPATTGSTVRYSNQLSYGPGLFAISH